MSTVTEVDELSALINEGMDAMWFEAVEKTRAHTHTYGLDAEQDARDLVMTTITNIYERRPDPSKITPGYLRTAVKNTFVDFLRSRHAENRRQIADALWNSRTPHTDEAAWIDLLTAVKALPENEQLAIAERYYGYKPGELLGVSRVRSHQLLVQARKRLSGQFKSNHQ